MSKVLIHLTTGLENPTKAALAFLVAKTGLEEGHTVAMFLAGDAVTLLRTEFGRERRRHRHRRAVGACRGHQDVGGRSLLFRPFGQGARASRTTSWRSTRRSPRCRPSSSNLLPKRTSCSATRGHENRQGRMGELLLATILGIGGDVSATSMQVMLRIERRCRGQVRHLRVRRRRGTVRREYLNSDPNFLAIVPVGGSKLVFVNVLSGSGARYVAGSFEWFTKGSDATLQRRSAS